MDGEHFSCDEEDYDTFSSVSQPGGRVLYDNHYSSWNEDQEHDVPPPAVRGTPDSFSLCSWQGRNDVGCLISSKLLSVG